MKSDFHIESRYRPTGDQPSAIKGIINGLERGCDRLTLEGVTGSGKTFTMANVIESWGKPTLILSHNKTLAAQLFAELKNFFPENAVEYFVSYYDYYQPEAYIPQTDTYIEKDSSINEEIERYRLSATNSLLGRRDVIIVASVSCIYGLGSPDDYREMLVDISPGMEIDRDMLLAKLVDIQYMRNDYESLPGNFRVRGDTVDIFPSYDKNGYRVSFFGDEIEDVKRFDPISGKTGPPLLRVIISPAKHFVMPREKVEAALGGISEELDQRIAEFEQAGKLVEAQRIRQRTEFDMEMMRELGYCNGIENYSRHLSRRAPGETPACLLDYFSTEFLTIIDESHATLPQLRAMYNGDQARKGTLIEHGFRLPSARDNRPLNFDEFMKKTGPIVFASATPSVYERDVSNIMAQQLIRPTGLLDPPVEVRPLENQIDDLMEQIKRTVEEGNRVLVTTLTKRASEDLTTYLKETGVKVEYLHSDIDALERVDILGRLRKGEFDCLIGINLLREGLDLPEVSLVAVLDADKEGFLRSATALMQTAGRAARHENGRVILYADRVTAAMQNMIDITSIRRERQKLYNTKHGITPTGIKRDLNESLTVYREGKRIESSMVAAESEEEYDVCQTIGEMQREMLNAADALEFERAAVLRDEIKELKKMMCV
ncbi:MAG: excinuclease ABC subunit UvrB [Kiritimatiellae bacterium]|jgi:excinuclease ABC subunit B|nr:excinuclease ABC subunit UvrB [Kiritimatiellia bacterium]